MSKGTSRIISIVIPARDEERTLPRCLDSIAASFRSLESAYPGFALEVVVVINRCTDRTEAIALERGCVIARAEPKNLAAIRNEGVRASSGEIIITIDADSVMSENMLREVVRMLRDRNAVGGGVLILPERWSLGIALTGLLLVPIAIYYRISGGLFYCGRGDFFAIGGFDESLASVEDIDFARRLRAHGRTIGKPFRSILHAHIVTSCRKFDRFGDWYFVVHLRETISLLRGRNQKLADKVWYDFEHKAD